MIDDIQTVLGAANFNGTAGRGLVTFDPDTIALPPDSVDEVPVIVHIAVQGNNVSTFDINCYLQRSGGGATERMQILFASDVTGFQLLGCRLPVPRDRQNNNTPWELVLFTTNKQVDASLIVHYEKGSAVVDDRS